MRTLIVAVFFLFAGCDEGVATRGPESPSPPPSASGGGASPDGGDECVRTCVESRQMEARAPEEIQADCVKECSAK